jgi:DNA-directed RNA polymerase specialized sigma24 family protein
MRDRMHEGSLYAEPNSILPEDAEDECGAGAQCFEMYDRSAVADFQVQLEARLTLEEIEGRIPEKDRSLYQQVFREGKSHVEAAQTLGKSQHAVESAVRRLRRRLRKKYSQ